MTTPGVAPPQPGTRLVLPTVTCLGLAVVTGVLAFELGITNLRGAVLLMIGAITLVTAAAGAVRVLAGRRARAGLDQLAVAVWLLGAGAALELPPALFVDFPSWLRSLYDAVAGALVVAGLAVSAVALETLVAEAARVRRDRRAGSKPGGLPPLCGQDRVLVLLVLLAVVAALVIVALHYPSAA